MVSLNCPFKDKKFINSILPMKLHHLLEIEHHIASSSDCSHPPLKFFIFDQHPSIINASTFLTPMQLAYQQGELDSVKRLVETWGVNLRAPANY